MRPAGIALIASGLALLAACGDDEPSRRRLWELVAALPEATAVVLATHDLAPETFRPTRAVLVDRGLEELALDSLHAHPLVCGHGHG